MNFLKRFGVWILAGLAIVAALLAKANPRKWQDIAVDNEEDDIQEDLSLAERANEHAQAHDDKAHAIKAEAEKEVPRETTSSLLDRWRSS